MEFVDYKCLESLLIEGEQIAVTEGLSDKIKSAAKFIGKTLLAVLRAIKNVILKIIEKIRALKSRKNGNETPKEAAARLAKENEELKAKLSKLEDELGSEKSKNETLKDNAKRDKEFYDTSKKDLQEDFDHMYKLAKDANNKNKDLTKKNETLESKKDRATKMIASLKKQISDNEAKIENIKEADKNKTYYDNFRKTCLTFIALVSQQTNKAYTVLPKFVEKAKKYNNKTRKDLLEDEEDEESINNIDFYTELQRTLPTMRSGSWSSLYKTLKYTYLEKIKENPEYLQFTGDIGRGFEELVKQSTQTITYLEKMVNDMNNNGAENNPAYKVIISDIMEAEGFIGMLQSSINLSNQILNCYVAQNNHIIHTVHDAI